MNAGELGLISVVAIDFSRSGQRDK